MYLFTRNLVRFFTLVLMQALMLNHIHLFGMDIFPMLYLMFVIQLPFETPRGLGLLLSFLMGLAVDLFSLTYGVHAAAATFAAFMRPAVLQLNAPRDGYEPGSLPRVRFYGVLWFVRYSTMLIIPHHLVYFILERFGFDHFGNTLLVVGGSSLFTLVLLLMVQYLFMKK